MTEDFFEAKQVFHNSVDFRQTTETIQKIKKAASVLIPRHGPLS